MTEAYRITINLIKSDHRVLDIGCGFPVEIIKKWEEGLRFQYQGIDREPKTNLNDVLLDWPDEFIYTQADIRNWIEGANDNSYDIIILSMILHFFKGNKRVQIIRYCINHLNEGGVLYFKSFNREVGVNPSGDEVYVFEKQEIETITDRFDLLYEQQHTYAYEFVGIKK